MNIAGEQFPAFNAYGGKVAYEIFVSGCDNHCVGCHNPELQDFNTGYPWYGRERSKLFSRMREVRNMFNVVAILGGDLLCQDGRTALIFVENLLNQFRDKEFWLFTGSEIEDVPKWALELFHVIKTGRYVQELHQEGFPASSNQRLLRKGVDY